MADTSFPLNTGVRIPALGLGTWQSAPGEVAKAVEHALAVGYRHIDAAYAYGNEEEVGLGLKKAFDAGLRREDVFVTTKLWSTHHRRVEENLDLSLKKLGLGYVDLYLMHWPVALNPEGNHPIMPTTPTGDRDTDTTRSHIATYHAMQSLLSAPPSARKTRAIGVANYSVAYLTALLADPRTKPVPAVNQIENHPLLPQDDVLRFCSERGIHVTAYSPLGSAGSPLLGLEAVKAVAGKHAVGPACVLISWHVQRGHSVLAKSVTPARIEANREIVALDEEDMRVLAGVSEGGVKRYVDPRWNVDLGFLDKQEGSDKGVL